VIVEPTSRDEIERRAATREPTPSILAIGRSIIVAAQIELRLRAAQEKSL
jgi:hypothetical protein